MQVPAGELEPSFVRVGSRRRHRPHGGLARAVPEDHDRAGRGCVAQRVGVNAEGAPHLAVGRPRAGELGVQPGGQVLGSPPPLRIVGESPQREHRKVAGRDDVCAVARPPDLDVRGIAPAGRVRAFDPGMHRQQRGARHAVLEARPGRLSERVASGWKPLVERADAPPEAEDLLPGQDEPRAHRLNPTTRDPSSPAGGRPACRRRSCVPPAPRFGVRDALSPVFRLAPDRP